MDTRAAPPGRGAPYRLIDTRGNDTLGILGQSLGGSGGDLGSGGGLVVIGAAGGAVFGAGTGNSIARFSANSGSGGAVLVDYDLSFAPDAAIGSLLAEAMVDYRFDFGQFSVRPSVGLGPVSMSGGALTETGAETGLAIGNQRGISLSVAWRTMRSADRQSNAGTLRLGVPCWGRSLPLPF